MIRRVIGCWLVGPASDGLGGVEPRPALLPIRDGVPVIPVTHQAKAI